MTRLFTSRFALNGAKVQFLLEEASIPHVVCELDLVAREHVTPESHARNLLGRVPWLEDDAFRLAESGAILRYVARRWRLEDWYPKGLRRRATVDQWLDFVNQHVGTALGALYVTRWFGPRFGWPMDIASVPGSLRALARDLPIVEERLGASRFLAAGHPTLADAALLPFVAVAPLAGVPIGEDYPALTRWFEAMVGRPAWVTVGAPWVDAIATLRAVSRPERHQEASG